MSKINNISDYIKATKEKNIKVIFCEGFEPQEYHGQVCKLIAGGSLQNYLFKTKAHSQARLPVHKNYGLFKQSLRKRAKEVINSKVGEVYGPGQIETVFHYSGYVTEL